MAEAGGHVMRRRLNQQCICRMRYQASRGGLGNSATLNAGTTSSMAVAIFCVIWK